MQGKCIYVSTRTTDSCTGWERVFRAEPQRWGAGREPARSAAPPHRAAVRRAAGRGQPRAARRPDRRTAGL